MFRHFSKISIRLYSSVAGSRLAVLRKKTGFPIGKCKEALSNNADDVDKAEKWLYERAQEEGWAKIDKLKDRTASQGLIGLLMKGNKAAMLEVNCETDFVARNEKFQSLVSTAIQAVFNHPVPTSSDAMLSTHVLNREEIGQVKSNSHTLADTVAEAVGFLAENLVLQRACVWCASRGMICGHVYNGQSQDVDDLRLGKYAVLVHLQAAEGGFADLEELGRNMCQQVIAMNPRVVMEGQEGVVDPALILTKQEFVFDESLTVGDLIANQGARVNKFVRFAVGENLQKTQGTH